MKKHLIEILNARMLIRKRVICYWKWRKGDPCYVEAKYFPKLYPVVMWKT
jgi:hypothetical protein